MEIKKPGLSDRGIALTKEPARNNPQPATTPRTERRYNVPKTWHTYTDQDKAAALAYLQSKGWRIAEAARDLGMPNGTLRGWAAGEWLPPAVREKYRVIKEGLSSKLENIAYQLIDGIHDTIPKASLKDLGATLAVVIDKMRLLREEPTAISESMDRRAMLERLIERTMEQFPGMTREKVIDIIRDVKPEAIKFLS
jgi:hypothetical protein